MEPEKITCLLLEHQAENAQQIIIISFEMEEYEILTCELEIKKRNKLKSEFSHLSFIS